MTFISGRLLLDKVGTDALLHYTDTFDMASRLQADPVLRDMSEVLAKKAVEEAEKKIIDGYLGGESQEEMSLSRRLMVACGAALLSGDKWHSQWGIVDQAKAEIEDDICVTFGEVDGYVLDHFTPSAVRLNSEPPRNSCTSIIDLHDSGTPMFKIQNDAEIYILLETDLAKALGGPEAVWFIDAVDKRMNTMIATL